MRPQIFLHIGMHKTGTTYLQHLFRRCRKQLLQADGLLFPETGLPLTVGIRPNPDGLPGHNEFTRRSRSKTIISELAAEIYACSPQRVFISAENLGDPRPLNFSRALVEGLEHIGSVSIILVVRRQDKWIDSYYRERVSGTKKGETRDFQTYLREEGPRLLDYGVRFQPWRQAPFSGRFLAASYDDLAVENRLLSWFCENLQVLHSADSLHLKQAPKHLSLTRLDAEITRLVNMLPDLEPLERSALLRHVYGLGMLPDTPFVTDEHYEEIRTCYEPKNKHLVDKWSLEPASEFTNWHRPKEQGDWAADVNTISSKLTAVTNGLQDICYGAQRRKRPFKNLVAKFLKSVRADL